MNKADPDNPYLTEHVYDGIEENDYPLPRWWLGTFWITVLFGFAYWYYYHSAEQGLLPRAEYTQAHETYESSMRESQRKLAENGDASLNESAMAQAVADPTHVARGRGYYVSHCAACHGQKGEGLVGPNLTDKHWLYEPTPASLYEVVAKGKLTKGMPAWGPVLGPTKVRDVLVYVFSIRDTQVSGKAPQGEKHE